VKVLIFGTVFADTEEKSRLATMWGTHHDKMNPDCDLLLVDSDSPFDVQGQYVPVHQLGDNIGHLSKGGDDGWGRAFCAGLQYAIQRNYDYVVHVEGDSLCRLDVMNECMKMKHLNILVMGTPVYGTKIVEEEWLETGLVFMSTRYLMDVKFIEQYDWRNGGVKKYPMTPEWWLLHIFNGQFQWQAWHTIRDDRKTLTVESVHRYDWVTHTTPKVFDAYVNA